MGCNNTKVESSTGDKRKHNKNSSNNNSNKQCNREDPENSRDRDIRISEMFIAAEKNATMILEQLKDDDVLSFSVVKNGGVAFSATLDGHVDNIHSNDDIGNRMPSKLAERLQSRLKEEYNMDERNIMADIIRAEEVKLHAQKIREMNERQESARRRREEMETNIKEKVNKKMQHMEEMQRRRERVRTAKSRMSTPSLHVLDY